VVTMRGVGRRGQKQGKKNNDCARPVRAWGDPSRHAPRVADGGGAGSAVVHILRMHARAVLVSQQADYRRGCAGAAPLRHAIHRLRRPSSDTWCLVDEEARKARLDKKQNERNGRCVETQSGLAPLGNQKKNHPKTWGDSLQSCLVLIQGWIAKEPTGMEKDCTCSRPSSSVGGEAQPAAGRPGVIKRIFPKRYSSSPKNSSLQLLQRSSKSVSAGS